MEQKRNTEFNCRYQVIGDTQWERIKTLKEFLECSIKALALEKDGKLKKVWSYSGTVHILHNSDDDNNRGLKIFLWVSARKVSDISFIIIRDAPWFTFTKQEKTTAFLFVPVSLSPL